MVRRAKVEPLLETFKWPGRLRERGSDANWFPVEYLAYLDHNGKRRSFTVRREDGGDIPDGHYVFSRRTRRTEFQMEKVEGQVASSE